MYFWNVLICPHSHNAWYTMSIFDRLSNLGRGAIKNAFSGEEAEPADPLARQLERLHKAYTSGILTEAEYQAKRTALVGGTSQTSTRGTPQTSAPRAVAPRTPIQPPAAEVDTGSSGGEDPEEDKPMKRTL